MQNNMVDKQFEAVLAKNFIARKLQEFVDTPSKDIILPVEAMLEALQDIENYVSTGNQPSVKDIFFDIHHKLNQ